IQTVAGRAAVLSHRALGRAGPAAIDVGLVAVLHVIEAAWNHAQAVGAHARLAVVLRVARAVDLALVAEQPTAIDVGLVAVLDAVVAGGRLGVGARIGARPPRARGRARCGAGSGSEAAVVREGARCDAYRQRGRHAKKKAAQGCSHLSE